MQITKNQKFGKWTALEDARTVDTRIDCECACGIIKSQIAGNLIYGQTTQCRGCALGERNKRNAKHGLLKHPLYGVWRGMRKRCNDPNNIGYSNYGQRGIKVCKNWNENFIEFYNWAIENNYSHDDGLDLDRIDNNANYSCGKCEECVENGWKLNCRWVTRKVNTNNRRTNHLVTTFGETKTIADWAEDSRCKVTYGTLIQRINRGIDSELAITTGELGYSGRFTDLDSTPLTETEVMELRKLFSEGNISATELNRKFNTCQAYNIVRGISWAELSKTDGLQDKINSVLEDKKHFVTQEVETQIVELAKTKKYKQSDIAKIVGFHQSHVSKILIKNGIVAGKGKKIYEVQLTNSEKGV